MNLPPEELAEMREIYRVADAEEEQIKKDLAALERAQFETEEEDIAYFKVRELWAQLEKLRAVKAGIARQVAIQREVAA